MTSLRDEIHGTGQKALLYIEAGRFDLAERILRALIRDHGPLANVLNLLGLCFHKQAKFREALEYFDKALEAQPNFTEAALNRTLILCDLGFYHEANASFEEIAQSPTHLKEASILSMGRLANLHAETAKAYEKLGLDEEAAFEYRKALKLFAKMPDIKGLLVRTYIRLRQWDQAQDELKDWLSWQPGSAPALNLMGIVLRKRGQINESNLYWLKAKEADPLSPLTKTYARIADSQ